MNTDQPDYRQQNKNREGDEGVGVPGDVTVLNSRTARFFSWLGRHFFAVTLVLAGLLLLFALL